MAEGPKTTRKRASDEEKLAQLEARQLELAEQVKAQRAKLREKKRKNEAQIYGAIGKVVSKGCKSSPELMQSIITQMKDHVTEKEHDRLVRALNKDPEPSDDESENGENMSTNNPPPSMM